MGVLYPDYILLEYDVATSTKKDGPTKVDLFERDDAATSTGSNGCVVCPSTTPAGPTCGAGEERLLRAQTCSQCPEYYCDTIDDNDSDSDGAPVGAIVGGVIGGLAFIAIAGLLYYFLIWKKKHPSLDDDEDIIMSEMEIDHDDKGSISNDSKTENSDKRVSSGGSTTAAGAALERPGNRRTHSNRRLSSYESFTRPQAKFKSKRVGPNGRPVGQRQLKSRNLINSGNLNSPYMDPNTSNRNSIATTISTTNASNILPIAYIPGVTVRPTKNNTKSIYSYETDSIFSDLNTIENASIIGDIMRANYNNQEPENNENNDNTMTAIKAQPRLVNVDRIEEEDEDEEDEEEDFELDQEVDSEEDGEFLDDTTEIATANSKSASKTSITTTTHHINESTLSNITDSILEEDDSDSDVDSDIGEIQRATSITRNRTQVRQIDGPPKNEIHLDLIDLGKPSKVDDRQSLNDGSFVLDVEIDNNERPQSQTSGERSPFEDP